MAPALAASPPPSRCAQQGFKPVLFEQAPRLGEVGAGLTIGPNASRVLSALGLEQRLQQLAREPRHTGMLHFKTCQALKVEDPRQPLP